MKDSGPDCARCAHYFVTWDAERAHGCRAFGFKSAHWPSAVVLRESGAPCGLHEPKGAGGASGASGAVEGGERHAGRERDRRDA